MPYRLHEPLDIKSINLTYYCRKCKQRVRGIPESNPVYHISEFDDNPWIICRCPNHLCDLTFVIYDRLNDRVFSSYPLPYSSADEYHESIPENIREDLAEADRCYNADAYRSTVVMLRRAVQSIVLDKISDPNIKKKKLWEQIDALFNEGYITKHLRDTAHEVRHFGNFGAHPTDDELNNTTREDAEMVDRLTHDLIRAIYVTPYETEKLKSKRNGK